MSIDGEKVGEYESQSGSVTTSLGITEDNVHTVTVESIGLERDEWISVLEVSKLWRVAVCVACSLDGIPAHHVLRTGLVNLHVGPD